MSCVHGAVSSLHTREARESANTGSDIRNRAPARADTASAAPRPAPAWWPRPLTFWISRPSYTLTHRLGWVRYGMGMSPPEPMPAKAQFARAVRPRHAPSLAAGGGKAADGGARPAARTPVARPRLTCCACCVCCVCCVGCVGCLRLRGGGLLGVRGRPRCGSVQSVARAPGRAGRVGAWRTRISRARFSEVEGKGVMEECAGRAPGGAGRREGRGRGQRASRLASSEAGAAARAASGRSDLLKGRVGVRRVRGLGLGWLGLGV